MLQTLGQLLTRCLAATWHCVSKPRRDGENRWFWNSIPVVQFLVGLCLIWNVAGLFEKTKDDEPQCPEMHGKFMIITGFSFVVFMLQIFYAAFKPSRQGEYSLLDVMELQATGAPPYRERKRQAEALREGVIQDTISRSETDGPSDVV
jgi:hypothetical protein